MSVSSYVSHCVKATLGENLYVEQTGFLGNKTYEENLVWNWC